MSHPLDDCVKKIDRAKEHILEIHNSLQGLFEGLNPNPVRVRYQYPPGESVFLLRGTPPPVDTRFSIFAGECVHQLRSTLDHVVYQLIIEKTKKPPTFNSAFPIIGKGKMKKGVWLSAADEYKAHTGRLKQDISPSAEALIHGLQPYKRGATYEEDPLWQLSELDNAYKHRLLVLTEQGVSSYTGTMTVGQRTITLHFTPPIKLEDGAELGRVSGLDFPLTSADDVKVDGQLVLNVAFSKLSGQRLVPVIPRLTQLMDYVRGIVTSLKPEFS